jgi:primosomal protein N' (replication factor Y)
MRAVAGHDVRGFYESELADRRELRNPPFTRLIRYVTRQQTEERAAGMADDLVLILGRHARAAGVAIEIIGPAPAFAAKVRGLFQWHVVVRLRPDQMDDMLFELPAPPGWSVDVDPQSLL